MALSRPPAEPGGGVISVKTEGLSPARPFHSSAARMNTRAMSPRPAAPKDRPRKMVFSARRFFE